jgi:hypothetical protein
MRAAAIRRVKCAPERVAGLAEASGAAQRRPEIDHGPCVLETSRAVGDNLQGLSQTGDRGVTAHEEPTRPERDPDGSVGDEHPRECELVLDELLGIGVLVESLPCQRGARARRDRGGIAVAPRQLRLAAESEVGRGSRRVAGGAASVIAGYGTKFVA